MSRLFGTDGIRGVFGEPPLDHPTVSRLGFELGHTLASRAATPQVLVGGDTRGSTPTLTEWLAQGLGAAGAQVHDLGVVPTPGVAYLVRHRGATCGVSISASHNPHPDNGLKLIDAAGFKWSSSAEDALAAKLLAAPAKPVPGSSRRPVRSDVQPYLEALERGLRGAFHGQTPLAGLRLCLDTANGAASPHAGELFSRLGAEVILGHAEPDGRNINRDCGSNHPQTLAAQIRERGADFGAAFDGDADRVVLCDGGGKIWDGDAILFLWARFLHTAGRLDPSRVVATTMSNLGLERSLERLGVGLVRCDVGDRAVVATLRREGLLLGGEQSGHIVNLACSTAGDGMQTALHMAALIHHEERPLAELLAELERYPQILRNVPIRRRRDFDDIPALRELVTHIEAELGREGRLLLRYSGTEPLARIMLEGDDRATLETMADELSKVLDDSLGGDLDVL